MTTTMKGIIGGGGLTFSASPATATVPTGSVSIEVNYGSPASITIPNGVRVVRVGDNYIGVTPNKKYTLIGWVPFVHHTGDEFNSFLQNAYTDVFWYGTFTDSPDTRPDTFTIFWSAEINTHTPIVTDY